MSGELIPHEEHPMTALARHSLGLGAEALIGTELVSNKMFRSRDLMERSSTIRALSADLRDIGLAWIQTRPPTEHNIDACFDSGSAQTSGFFPKGERSFARLRIRTW